MSYLMEFTSFEISLKLFVGQFWNISNIGNGVGGHDY